MNTPWIVLFVGVTAKGGLVDKEEADALVQKCATATAGNVRAVAIPQALAEAAPDLLAAVERALPLLERVAHPYNHEHSAAVVLRAAIAKAKGGAA